jgi:nicotinamidase-related amidase
MKKLHLLIIDPQRDFCDPNGTLAVPGADADMKRLSDMINRIGDKYGIFTAPWILTMCLIFHILYSG